MSQLEHEARGVVVRLLVDRTLNVTPEDAATLSRWVTKTACLLAAYRSGRRPPPVAANELRREPWAGTRAEVRIARMEDGWDGFMLAQERTLDEEQEQAIFVDFVMRNVVFSVAVVDPDFPFVRWHELLHRNMLTVWSGGSMAGGQQLVSDLPAVTLEDVLVAARVREAIFDGRLRLPPAEAGR